jgi:cell wall-associated NlpC family hydrolase
VHAQFVRALTQQYESGPGASVATLLTSSAPQEYLDNLAMANYLSSRFAATVRAQATARADAAAAARRSAAALQAARTKEADLAQRRAALNQQSQRFRQLLDSLTAQQRAQLAHARAVAAAQARAELADQQTTTTTPAQSAAHPHAKSDPPPPTGPVSASVQRVIAFAEAQIGKTYSYGGDGPNAYDCSGLTMAAWAKAGVHLPHSAAGQYSYGRHVSYDELQPGDLIFLYSPIGHVELYVGHDLAVSAANESIGIVYVHPSRDRADFTGATRLTG